MDLYEILGVGRDASQDDIKAAYRKKAFESHPDRNPGDPEANKRFKDVQAAYDTLTDPIQKSKYDGATGRSSSARHGPRPFEGIWDNIFGGAPPPRQERGRNLHLTLDIELIDVLNGVEKKAPIPRRERCNKCEAKGFTEFKPCEACHGSGKNSTKQSMFSVWSTCTVCVGSGRAGHIPCDECKGEGFVTAGTMEIGVKIPPGVDTGYQVRLQGYGEPSKYLDGKNGDLVTTIIVKPHKLFKRNGVNLSYELPIGFSELCLGSQVEVPTLVGTTLLSIPPRTQDYTNFRIKMLGLPYLHGGKGDLIITVKLALPSFEIIDSNKEILEKFRDFEKLYLAEERNKLK